MSVPLDANVVSKLIRKACELAVASWIAGLRVEDLFFPVGGFDA